VFDTIVTNSAVLLGEVPADEIAASAEKKSERLDSSPARLRIAPAAIFELQMKWPLQRLRYRKIDLLGDCRLGTRPGRVAECLEQGLLVDGKTRSRFGRDQRADLLVETRKALGLG